MNKVPDTSNDTRKAFNDFTRRYKVTHKLGNKQKQKT